MTKLFDLQEWNSRMRVGADGKSIPIFLRTIIWGKPYAICRDMKMKLSSYPQLPGTYYKIVPHGLKSNVS